MSNLPPNFPDNFDTSSNEENNPLIPFSEFSRDKTFEEFIGREAQIQSILGNLFNPFAKILNISGLGGMGKTALAIRAIELQNEKQPFDHVVWSSAKKKIFTNLQIEDRENKVNDYTIDSAMNDIAKQCNRLDIIAMPPDQRKWTVAQLLQSKKVLVVLDNMETLKENAAPLVDEIYSMIKDNSQSKILTTSRHKIPSKNVEELPLGGFSQIESLNFLLSYSKSQNIDAVAQLPEIFLNEIYEKTGGAALALQLVVGQLGIEGVTIDRVLDNLRKAKYNDQTYDFYRFMFRESWELLTNASRNTLVSMSVFAPSVGGETEEIQAIAGIEDAEFAEALTQLLSTSLVDKVLTRLQKIYYKLHMLTLNFVLSDITGEKKWEEGLEDL